LKKTAAILYLALMLPWANTNRAMASSLETQTGNDIGLSVSSYQYQEPGVMSSSGIKMGVDLRATKVLQQEQFIRGDVRYAFGTVDYTGSGQASGEPDLYFEIRGLVGKDNPTNAAVFSPYIGLGYRHLFNDARGITSTGATGYRRTSQYFYLPIGIIHRQALNDQAQLESTLEYDHLLLGIQSSKLSDAGLGYGDVTNKQNSGYGLKLDVIYLKDKLGIGPYVHYWNIDKSETATVYQHGAPVGIGWEPENNTVEFGLKAQQKF
jgi:hypothetical protein